jgi:hypothetical protein
LGCLTLQMKALWSLKMLENYFANDKAWHPRSRDSSATLQWEHKIPQASYFKLTWHSSAWH